MPETVEGLGGSCVVVPCSFSIPPEWEDDLDQSCKAIWKRGSWSRTQVFDSSLTGASANLNILQGELIGSLRQKDCSTVFNNLPSNHYDNYYFRLQCDNSLKFNFQKSVQITTQSLFCCYSYFANPPIFLIIECVSVTHALLSAKTVTSVLNFTASSLHDGQKLSCSALYTRQAGNTQLLYERALTLQVFYPPDNTSVSHSGPVTEGSSVTLSCSAEANPAVDSYSWYNPDGEQKALSTSLAQTELYCFSCLVPPKETTVVLDHAGPVVEGSSVSLLCRSRSNPPVTNYTWFRGEEEDKEPGSVLVLTGVDASHSGDYRCTAKNQLGEETSAPVRLDVQCESIQHRIRCSCDSHANPPPSLEWELAGEAVNHSADIPIKQVSLGGAALRSLITLYRVDEDAPSLVCLSSNALGSDSLAFNVSASETQLGRKLTMQKDAFLFVFIYFVLHADSFCLNLSGIHTFSLLVGSAVGAVGMLVVCVPLLIFFCRLKNTKTAITDAFIQNRILPQQTPTHIHKPFSEYINEHTKYAR
uniref:Ig-like domain-containing protein n=1 Tax=Salarias fasciatus TaxID=181472 RepID=A0A672FKJ3_SALFA